MALIELRPMQLRMLGSAYQICQRIGCDPSSLCYPEQALSPGIGISIDAINRKVAPGICSKELLLPRNCASRAESCVDITRGSGQDASSFLRLIKVVCLVCSLHP